MLIYLSFIGYKGFVQMNTNIGEEESFEISDPVVYPVTSLVPSLSDNKEEEPKANPKKEYEEEFSLPIEVRQKIKADLLDFMETSKPYLNQKLLINQLARDINTNNKYLSYVINKEFDQNFVTFINNYRISESKIYMQDAEYENYKIEAIGNMAGFKSRSSFNNAFKNITGETPSAFRKRTKSVQN